jgi:hypothetical protein
LRPQSKAHFSTKSCPGAEIHNVDFAGGEPLSDFAEYFGAHSARMKAAGSGKEKL